MSLLALIESFANATELPITPDDIAKQIKELGIKDVINFIPVDIDENILRGYFYHYIRHAAVYGDPLFCVNVFYSKHQSAQWRSFVCCKELLHVFDPPNSSTKTPEQVYQLLVDLENGSAENYSPPALRDMLAITYALCILMPNEARDIFLKLYKDGKITAQQISVKTNIPEHYIKFLMSDEWPPYRAAFIRE